MTFHHEPVFDGRRWHTAYRLPGTAVRCSVMDAGTERAARQEAERRNRDVQRSAAPYVEPADRQIPLGFYENIE